jgi:hypothetical protein
MLTEFTPTGTAKVSVPTVEKVQTTVVVPVHDGAAPAGGAGATSASVATDARPMVSKPNSATHRAIARPCPLPPFAVMGPPFAAADIDRGEAKSMAATRGRCTAKRV